MLQNCHLLLIWRRFFVSHSYHEEDSVEERGSRKETQISAMATPALCLEAASRISGGVGSTSFGRGGSFGGGRCDLNHRGSKPPDRSFSTALQRGGRNSKRSTSYETRNSASAPRQDGRAPPILHMTSNLSCAID